METATLTRRGPGITGRSRTWAPSPGWWPRLALAAMCVAALVGYLAFPTFPTYDSFYALLWGRDLLHLHLPDLSVYRAPTEHPLAIAFGLVCSIFGQAGARLMVLGSVASFVAAVAGVYRLGRVAFGPLVGVVAAVLLLSRFFVENLAAQGYLDISYLAIVVWAVALEAQRPRRGTPVFLLLAAAGLLRPDAWVLSGLYWVWCCWPLARGGRGALAPVARYLALALLAPVVWMGFDAAITGAPLHSLSATAELAQELERTQGLAGVLGSLWTYGVRIDHTAVVVGALLGAVAAVLITPRRAALPLAAMGAMLLAYVGEGAAGASVIDRYLLGTATLALLFCAVAVGGWTMLERGRLLRRVWMGLAAVLVVVVAATAVSTLSLSGLRTTLAEHYDFHQGLASALHSAPVRRAVARCRVLSLPDNKLIPDARWILGTTGQQGIVARSEARSDSEHGASALARRLQAGSVAVYPLGAAVFKEAIVDTGDNALDQVPQGGFRRIYTSRYYAVYENC